MMEDRMRKTLITAALAAAIALPAAMPSVAYAQSNYDRDHAYQGRDGRYDQNCKHSKGTTGLIAGGVAGGVAGHVLGGGTLGTLAGAGGGALLGRHLDKKHDEAQNRKNGC
jgi:outer membrane lipoprotein SlyB